MRAQREAQYEESRKRAVAAKKPPKPDLPLTEAEVRKLVELEEAITRGARTFVEVGAALTTIREARWYRKTHATFEGYCQDKWGWSARRARQLEEGSRVVRELYGQVEVGTIVPIPATETQARELAKVPKRQRVSVLREAAKAAKRPGKPTAQDIRTAAGIGTVVPTSTAIPAADAPTLCPCCGRPL